MFRSIQMNRCISMLFKGCVVLRECVKNMSLTLRVGVGKSVYLKATGLCLKFKSFKLGLIRRYKRLLF